MPYKPWNIFPSCTSSKLAKFIQNQHKTKEDNEQDFVWIGCYIKECEILRKNPNIFEK